MKIAKIIIKDEVNAKIEGLSLDVRKALTKRFEYEKPGARYLPSVRLGRWNGKVSFFSLSGSTYINLLDQIIPYLIEHDYEIKLEDRRTEQKGLTFSQITSDTFADTCWPEKHPAAGKPIELRDYQVEIVNTFLANPQSIQQIATGAGKTLITAALSKSVEHLGRSLVIVPNKSLVVQTEADYINLGLNVGVYFGDRKEIGKTHTICTWQSLNVLFETLKNKQTDFELAEFFFEGIACIIVDEAHMSKSDVLKTMLTNVFSDIPIRWGLTGTIPKEEMDRVTLLTSIGPVVGNLSAKELQDKGVLANCHVNIIQIKDNKEFSNYQSELKHLLEDKHRLDRIAEMVQMITETGNTLVLVDRVNAGKELEKRLTNSVFVNGNTKLAERKEEYDEVATSDDKIIIATYGVAAVGINIPRIFNLVLIEPGKSFVRVIQSIGRGVRKAEDKDFVQIWDICSTSKFSKRHLTQRKQFYKEASYPFTIEKLDI
jgi:superfamily II DNA or RNA helicase